MTTMNPVSTPKRVYEPDDLLSLPNAVDYELVDGQLVERAMGSESSLVGSIIIFLLRQFLKGKKLAHVFGSDTGYQCFPDDPKKLRKADVSVVLYGRLPGEQIPKGHTKIAPDLAVEVISPRDLTEETEEKVSEYLAAGVRLVWIVFPAKRTVWVRRPANATEGPATELKASDTITGESVLPGFACKVNEFFEEP